MQYFAGLIDGDGSIKVSVKDRRNRVKRHTKTFIGYEFQPMVSIKTTPLYELVETFKNFVKSLGINPFVSWSKSYVTFGVCGRESVQKFLEAIYPYLIIKKKEAKIMLHHIIPMLKQGKHLTKTGIIELMHYIDQMNTRTVKRKKYSEEYFRNLFKIPLSP